ncbi:high mobility group protein HMG-I/HMG-Y-like [Eublepharis macularius]|uniref:High mobility group protein HMG-I/HMG-Y-like n=1 Tax=Eublepharis macularius TaxID=481883 RepID=A0AA97J4U0_EUBMA|nr:high mobility group protein HMG-I/HMG-Y-like [Eublepharis macularius]
MSTLAKSESAPLTEQPKRKRGRPRKLPEESAGPLLPKKPRGRPKGSKELHAGGRQKVHASTEKSLEEDHENGFSYRRKYVRKPVLKRAVSQVLAHSLP